jgi:hypothetical protein
MRLFLALVSVASSALIAAAALYSQAPAEKVYDADAEKVLVLSDFESPEEIFNGATEKDFSKAKPLESKVPIWLAHEDAKWQANRLEISDEHVFHGRHSLKAHGNVGSGHAWTPTVRRSFNGDWTGYDAIRFFAHSPEDKPVQWALFIWLGYTDADGKPQEIQPWLLFSMKKGDAELEIPLSAFDDLKWQGPVGGCGGGINMTAMKLWDQDKKYDYLHKNGWKFNDIRAMAVGLRGNYDQTVAHDYWVDYIRLVKKKK